MDCKQCGREIREGASFCPYCGSPVQAAPKTVFCIFCGAELPDEAAFCPNCGKQVPPEISMRTGSGALPGNRAGSERQVPPGGPVPSGSRADPPTRNRSGTGKALIIAAVIIIAAAVILFMAKPWQKREAPQEVYSSAEEEHPEDSAAEDPSYEGEDGNAGQRIDPDEYFEQNAEIISSWDAEGSETVKNETDACVDLENRGFTQCLPETEYSITGECSEAKEISPDSSEKHPVYTTYYANSTGEVWTVFMIDSSVVAYPVSYNLQSETDVQLVLSESEEIISYDSGENAFYKTIPDPSALNVKVVDHIDAAALDRLTIEEISAL